MLRWFPLAAFVVLAAASTANAIEMFTNFHNGENIGFPPIEVPSVIYGGFGHGGWNPHAQGMPFRSINPVPSMMPTGQVPGRFGIGGPQGVCIPTETSQPIQESQAFQPVYVSDRRHGRWQRSGAASGGPNEELSNDSTRSSDQPTIAPSKPDEVAPSNVKNGPTKSILPKAQAFSPAAVVRPDANNQLSESVPSFSDVDLSTDFDRQSQSQTDFNRQSNSTADKWSKASALFPNGEFN